MHPASGNDRGTLLGALEFVAGSGVELAEIVGTVIGHDVAFESGPQLSLIHI